MQEAHLLGAEAELVGDDLAVGGGVALAVVLRAHGDRERPGGVETELGALDQADIGGGNRARYSPASDSAPHSGLFGAEFKALIVGVLQAVGEVFGEVAA